MGGGVRVAAWSVVLFALAGCGGDGDSDSDGAAPPTSATSATPPTPTTSNPEGDDSSDGDTSPTGDIDPCGLLDDGHLAEIFVDLFEPPTGERTSPGGITDLCTWQDVGAGALLRVELDTVGRIPVPPADPSCSSDDCPDPGIGVESRADLRDTIRFVVAQLDDVTLRVQTSGLELTGDELIAVAAAAAGRIEG